MLWFQVASVREEASLAQREDGTFLCAFLRGALAAFSPTFIKTSSSHQGCLPSHRGGKLCFESAGQAACIACTVIRVYGLEVHYDSY